MGQVDERRQWQRSELNATILFRAVEGPGARPFQAGRGRDISDGGISFHTETPPAKGAVINLFFSEQANTADRRVRGLVAWTRSTDQGMMIGVSYVRPGAANRAVW